VPVIPPYLIDEIVEGTVKKPDIDEKLIKLVVLPES